MEAELQAQVAGGAHEDDGESVVGDIVGSILVGLIEAAICGDCDDDDDETARAQPDERRRRVQQGAGSKPAQRVERAPKPSSDRRGRPQK